MTVEKIWTRDFSVVWVIHFVITIVFYLLLVTIGQYAIEQYDVSISIAGLVSGIFVVGSLIGRLIAGRFLTLMTSKKVMVIGLILLWITTACYFLQMNLISLMLLRLGQGFAMGMTGTAAGTFVAEILPSKRKGEGMGYFSLGGIVGTALGPSIGIFLTQWSSEFTIIFKVNLFMVISCVGFCFLLDKRKPVRQSTLISKRNGLSNYVEVNVIPLSIIALLVGLSFSGVISFLPLYTDSIDLVTAGGYFFLIYALSIILIRPFIGKWFDRAGANVVIYPSLLLFAFGMFLFSSADSSLGLLLSAVCIGIGFGNFNTVAQAFVIIQTPKERLGVATSTYLVLFDLGMGTGPFLLGFLVPQLGYRGIFSAMVFVIFIGLGMYYKSYGGQKNTKNFY